MASSSYRLDSVTVTLIERLEGARPTWIGDEAHAREGFRRIVEEHVDSLVAERQEILGPEPEGEAMRREVLETFLPRYTRLAIDHNADEEAGYHAWRRGDPVARVLGTLFAFALVAIFYRAVHHPAALLLLITALTVPFVPELRRAWYRRRYRALLQETVDDMARIQLSLESRPPALLP